MIGYGTHIDFYPICFLVLFAFINELVTTLSFMCAPRMVMGPY